MKKKLLLSIAFILLVYSALLLLADRNVQSQKEDIGNINSKQEPTSSIISPTVQELDTTNLPIKSSLTFDENPVEIFLNNNSYNFDLNSKFLLPNFNLSGKLIPNSEISIISNKDTYEYNPFGSTGGYANRVMITTKDGSILTFSLALSTDEQQFIELVPITSEFMTDLHRTKVVNTTPNTNGVQFYTLDSHTCFNSNEKCIYPQITVDDYGLVLWCQNKSNSYDECDQLAKTISIKVLTSTIEEVE